jgi:pantoate--beta-alanine ligase
MERITTIAALRSSLAVARREGKRIALVPTMGALHEGHLSLVDAARQSADLVVMSVFVNHLQFGLQEDLGSYPRSLERDADLAAGRGVDLLFAPDDEEMYHGDTGVRVTPGKMATAWEGTIRPGHFEGVLTVVAKLFHIVGPSVAWFGQKDVQQVIMIRSMVHDLNMPVEIGVAPIVRDRDGLALSSRNAYLSAEERQMATAIPRALGAVLDRWRGGERAAGRLRDEGLRVLATAPELTVDYLAIVEATAMTPVEVAAPGCVVAVAARVGATRLLDNLFLDQEAL